MKKLLFLLLILTFVFSGCGKKETVVPVENNEVDTPVVEETAPSIAEETNTRPIAVMIDNDGNDSRPHAGLEDAYLLYEMYVEGNATRIMALFKDTNTAKIGPVRSSRHYFLDYALENDAIYVHFGWSPQAQKDIPALGVKNINGVLGGDGSIFWREEKYKGDYHSAFTSIEKINKYASGTKKYTMTTDKTNLKRMNKDLEAQGDALTEITLPYAGFYAVKYTYDETSKTYKRFLNGSGHITQANVHLAAKNLIIQQVSNSGISGDDKGRQNLNTTGSGNGYYITNGTVRKITWSKNSRSGSTIYKYENGEEVILNPGQTWIQLVPPSMNLGI